VAENAERDGENRFLIDARGEGALPSWLSFSLVRAARSRGVARAASPAPAGGGGSETVEFCVFRLDFALTGDWRRYEIRWRRPEAPDAPRGKVVLAAEQGICHVAAAPWIVEIPLRSQTRAAVTCRHSYIQKQNWAASARP
jgi:hypothetical protein